MIKLVLSKLFLIELQRNEIFKQKLTVQNCLKKNKNYMYNKYFYNVDVV